MQKTSVFSKTIYNRIKKKVFFSLKTKIANATYVFIPKKYQSESNIT